MIMVDDKSNSNDTDNTNTSEQKSSPKTTAAQSKTTAKARKPQTIELSAKSAETVETAKDKPEADNDEKAKTEAQKAASNPKAKNEIKQAVADDLSSKKEEAKTQKPEKQKRGGIGFIAACLMFFIGLPLGVGAGYYAINSNLLAGFGFEANQDVKALDERTIVFAAKVKELEAKLQNIEGQVNDQSSVDKLNIAVDALQDKVISHAKIIEGEGLNSALLSPIENRLSTLSKNYESLQQTLTTAQATSAAASGSGDSQPVEQAVRAAKAMNERILRLEEQLNAFNQTAASVQSEDARIRAQFEQLSAQMQLTLSETAKRNEELKLALSDVESNIARSKEVREATFTEVNKKIIASVDEITNLKKRIATVGTDLIAMQEAISAPGSEQSVAQVLSIQYLTDALSKGDDITNATKLAKQAGLNPVQVDQLSSLVQQGVPTLENLISSFGLVEKQLLADIARQEDSFTDRLLGSAQSALNIRRTGMPQGDEPQAIVTRMRTLVDGGEIAPALDEANMLPQASKERLAGWQEIAQRYILTQTILTQLQGDVANK